QEEDELLDGQCLRVHGFANSAGTAYRYSGRPAFDCFRFSCRSGQAGGCHCSPRLCRNNDCYYFTGLTEFAWVGCCGLLCMASLREYQTTAYRYNTERFVLPRYESWRTRVKITLYTRRRSAKLQISVQAHGFGRSRMYYPALVWGAIAISVTTCLLRMTWWWVIASLCSVESDCGTACGWRMLGLLVPTPQIGRAPCRQRGSV